MNKDHQRKETQATAEKETDRERSQGTQQFTNLLY